MNDEHKKAREYSQRVFGFIIHRSSFIIRRYAYCITQCLR